MKTYMRLHTDEKTHMCIDTFTRMHTQQKNHLWRTENVREYLTRQRQFSQDVLLLFEIGFLCVALAVLELTL